MRTHVILLTILLGLQFISCKKAVQTSVSSDALTINLDELQQVDKEYYSTLFEGAGVIVLETTENSLLSRVDRMEFLDDNLYVLESDQGLFRFDKTGKFIKKIGGKGSGPGEYISPTDFTIDRTHKKIYLLDVQTQTVIRYSAEGDYEELLNLKDETSKVRSICFRIHYFNDRLYTDLYVQAPDEEKPLLAELDLKSGKRMRTFLNADQHKKGWNELYFTMQRCFVPTENPKFMQSFMDTIFEINKDGVMPYIIFKSENLATREKIDDKWGQSEKFYEVFRAIEHAGKICEFSEYIESDAFICFKYLMSRYVHIVLHKKREGTTCLVRRMVNDIFYNENAKRPLIFNLTSFDKERAYSIIMDNDYSRKSTMENLNTNGINSNVEGIENLKGLDDDSNPVIVYFKFKK